MKLDGAPWLDGRISAPGSVEECLVVDVLSKYGPMLEQVWKERISGAEFWNQCPDHIETLLQLINADILIRLVRLID